MIFHQATDPPLLINLVFWVKDMSKNYSNKIADDKKHNRYLLILFVFTLLYGLSGITALVFPSGVIFLEVVGFGKSLFSIESIVIFRICTCSTYPITVTFALVFAWYSFTKRPRSDESLLVAAGP